MRRWLFNVAAAVSLVMCVATAALWVWSSSNPVHIAFSVNPTKKLDVMIYGRFIVVRVFDPTSPAPFANNQAIYKQFPSWPCVTAFAVLPIISTLSLARGFLRKQEHEGLCSKCGYDLRATPDRCPECGTEVKRRPTPAKIST